MEWVETLIGFVIIFGCGLGVYLFGVWAGKQEKPMGFWANGKPFDPGCVTDVPGYIREYGALFRRFAAPCMIAGILVPIHAVASLVILIAWAVFGIWWLINQYRKIEKRYILQESLDKS